MSAFIDYYKIINVPDTSTKTEVRTAYLSQVKRLHSGKTQMERDQMVILNLAYNTLCNDARRREYDRIRVEQMALMNVRKYIPIEIDCKKRDAISEDKVVSPVEIHQAISPIEFHQLVSQYEYTRDQMCIESEPEKNATSAPEIEGYNGGMIDNYDTIESASTNRVFSNNVNIEQLYNSAREERIKT